MQQHPIPQDITGYRFHIVGSMTLKQFGEVFLSVIVAVLIFNTNLVAVVKWPLIILTVTMGVVAAFVPIQGKPLTHWVGTFVKVMYKPTKFFWKRTAVVPEYFLFQSQANTVVQEPELDLTPAKRQRIKEYLGSVPDKDSFSTDFSQDELSRMKGILSSFETVETNVKIISSPKTTKKKPKLDIRVRSMRAPSDSEEIAILRSENRASEPFLVFEKKEKKEKTVLSNDQVAQNIQIPEKETIIISAEEEKEKEIKEKEIIETSSSDSSEKTFIKDQVPTEKDLGTTKDVDFNSSLPFPIKPTKPNKLVGMVLSKGNDLLTDSIVEVQTTGGQIERAVKTNALGQFFITTPLRVGEYKVVVEKEGYVFQPLHIKINDTIIQPIEVRSEN